jgi:NADPH-dependent F420 reductase
VSVIGILGGTGKLGGALAARLAGAGHDVVLGSRNAEAAADAAGALSDRTGRPVDGCSNLDAAGRADIIVSAVPFDAQVDRLTEIREAARGKILVETAVPLTPGRAMRVSLPPEGSAAQRAQALLGPDVRVVSAFHNVSAEKLAGEDEVACDVLVFSDDKAARAAVVALVEDMGLNGLEGGVLANSAAAEALTSVLIFINRTYKVAGSGVAITGSLIKPSRT